MPVREATAQYKYVFTGWDGIKGTVPELTSVKAMYVTEDQYYDVYWHNKNGDILYTVKNVKYGDPVVYDYGEDNKNWPKYTANELEYYEYSVFTGWDISTGVITGETHVYAQYETVNGLPSTDDAMKDMTVAQIYSIVASDNSDNYFDQNDYVDIQLGNDYHYDNVNDNVIVKNKTLDGTASSVFDSDIKLCGSDSPAFTMAIDFEFGTTSSGATLMSCFEEEGSKGLRLYYNNNPTIQWGDQTMTVGYGTQRNMVVIRHAKGADTIHVYVFNNATNTYSTEIKKQSITRTTQQFTDRPIIVGGFRYDPEPGADVGKISGLCKGTVHWFKVWDKDLGDVDAESLAAWTHETVRFRCCEKVIMDELLDKKISGRYTIDSKYGRKTGVSFICEDLLTYGYQINSSSTNAGGWAGSEMRAFCNSRVYNAFPTIWKSVIKRPYIPANNGDPSYDIVTSQDYIYLPSYIELNAKTGDPYNKEGAVITSMAGDSSRIKKQNGVASKYWTRSAEKYVDRAYWGYITETGAYGSYVYVGNDKKYGICPCFSI